MNDLRYALRGLRGSGGYTILAVLTLALGIGANTAIFSVVDGVVIRPLAYEDSDRVLRVRGHERGGDDFGTVSYPNFRDLQEQATAFEAVAAQHGWQPVMSGDGEPELLQGASVTADYFRVLGIAPVHGRFFLEAEDEPGSASVVILGHDLWERRFGADPSVVGETVELGDAAYEVIGVAPDFEDPRLRDARLELWRVSPAYFGSDELGRSGRSFNVIARLRPEASLDRAQTEVNTIMRSLEEAYPEANTGRGLRLVPLKDEIVGPMRPALLTLLAATGLVLLIACANVANLQLSRSARRTREIAVRSALGAPRGRIVRHLLTESTLLALLGGAVGVALAYWATDLLVALGGPELPRADSVGVDARVLAFAVGASFASGLLFGFSPALRASRTDLRGALTGSGRGSTGGRSDRRFRGGLVAGQVALAMVVLVGAGLLVRSLSSLRAVDPGFHSSGVLTVWMGPAFPDEYEGDALTGMYERVLDRVAALPGVEGVGAIDILPASGDFNGMTFTIEGRPAPEPGETPMAQARAVMPGYFSTMGIPLERGRVFTRDDGSGAPAVVMINEAMARRHWPDENPVGARLTRGGVSHEIVGVVGDVRQFGPAAEADPAMYFTHAQAPADFMRLAATLVVRTSVAEPTTLAPRLRGAIRSVEPATVIRPVRPMDDWLAATLAPYRSLTLLLSVFASVALALGAVGVYGVVAHSVSRRTNELAIRMALGARARTITAMVLREGMAPVLLGVAIGAAGSLAIGRGLSGMLFGVEAADPPTFAGIVILLVGVALVASYIPAQRATRVDPMVALKEE